MVALGSRREGADPTAVTFLTSGDEITLIILQDKAFSVDPEVLVLVNHVYEYTT